MLTTTYPIPQNSLMPPPADEQLSQAYRAAQVEAAGLTARAASPAAWEGRSRRLRQRTLSLWNRGQGRSSRMTISPLRQW